MNKLSYDILKIIKAFDNVTQRFLKNTLGVSLGSINSACQELTKGGYIHKDKLTERGIQLIKERKPKNAIILAAGIGMRMVPINTVTPKGLLEVESTTLIVSVSLSNGLYFPDVDCKILAVIRR